MGRKNLIKNLLDAAYALDERKLWEQFTNFDCFGVRLAGQDEPVLCSVMGDAGQEYGLALFRGPHAVVSLATLLDPEGPGDDVLEEMDTLQFSMEPFGDMAPPDQAIIRQAGLRPAEDDWVPLFVVKRPYHQGHPPNESEITLLLQVLRGILQADAEDLLYPTPLDNDKGICVLNISGTVDDVQVSAGQEKWEQAEEDTNIPFFHLDADLSGLPRLNATWLVGLPPVPATIEDDDRAMVVLLVFDETNESIVHGMPVFAGDIQKTVDTLVETFGGQNMIHIKGLPQEILFSSRKLCNAMTPILKPLNVRCRYKPEIPQIQAVAEHLFGKIDDELSPFEDMSDVLGQETDQCPAPDDMVGWRQADGRLLQRFAQRFAKKNPLEALGPIERYFGDIDLEYYFENYREDGVMDAYTAWGILDYRSTKKGRTEAEKMLAQGLPGPEAVILQARMESYPSLYRIIDQNLETGAVELEDVLLGGTVTVQDPVIAEDYLNDMCIAARVFKAGHVHFVQQIGPVLDPEMEAEAIEFLQEANLEFTPEGLLRDAHWFGRLWAWMDDLLDESMPLESALDMPDYVEMTPEIVSSVQELMNRQYMDWIDTPHPALGETPRQACRVESGRREVAKLIRTMPEPDGPVEIEIPRQAMMAKLGLDCDVTLNKPRTPKSDTPSIPIRTVESKPKVAQNAPCPCGSGHKYKKCCGRQHSH